MGRQMRRGGIEPSDLTAEVNRVAENTQQQVGSKLANRFFFTTISKQIKESTRKYSIRLF
jgi:hypothetical protein